MVIIHGLGCAFLVLSLSRLPGSSGSLKGRAVSVRFAEGLLVGCDVGVGVCISVGARGGRPGHNGNGDMDNYYDEEAKAILRGKGHVNVLCYITGYFNDKSSYT